jgi:hypothetical protein
MRPPNRLHAHTQRFIFIHTQAEKQQREYNDNKFAKQIAVAAKDKGESLVCLDAYMDAWLDVWLDAYMDAW